MCIIIIIIYPMSRTQFGKLDLRKSISDYKRLCCWKHRSGLSLDGHVHVLFADCGHFEIKRI